jgi:hypothetical protein
LDCCTNVVVRRIGWELLSHYGGTEGEFLGAGTAEGEEERRFRVRECRDLSSHREPRSRTRRSVCQ